MKKIINAILGIDAGTRKRAIASIVTFAVNALAIFGGIEVADEKVNLIIKGLVAVATAIVWILGFFFNENYTPEGCEGTGYTRLKKENPGAFDVVEEAEAGTDVLDGIEND